MTQRVAVVGAGWAGLAAAVRLRRAGCSVTVLEMASKPGGRARTVDRGDVTVDNGQHILIGAYRQSLDLMRTVGVDTDRVLSRLPLALVTPDGRGLRLPSGGPMTAFVRGVLGHGHWPRGARLALLVRAGHWAVGGFRCGPSTTVAELCAGLPAVVNQELIEPLCVAALNTPAHEASGQVFLRVLKDALFSGPGSADLLLPRAPLGELLASPATQWLAREGARVELGHRVQSVSRHGTSWQVDGETFDGVVLACTATEAARLVESISPAWSAQARALHYEPIVTVNVQARGQPWPAPMVSLPEGPAQFGFDLGALGGMAGHYTFVVSGAANWVEAGLDATEAAVLAQLEAQFPAEGWTEPPQALATLAERRATFRCTPGLSRPPVHVAPGLVAAGDYIDGPYPATLEGAVRAGEAAASRLKR